MYQNNNNLKQFPFHTHFKLTTFISLWSFSRNKWICLVGDFLCMGLLVGCMLIKLHGVVLWEYETIFNTKYFIFNRKIIALYSYHYLGDWLLLHAYTHMQPHHAWLLAQTHISWHVPLSHLQECFPYTHAELHTTCLLILPVWDES